MLDLKEACPHFLRAMYTAIKSNIAITYQEDSIYLKIVLIPPI